MIILENSEHQRYIIRPENIGDVISERETEQILSYLCDEYDCGCPRIDGCLRLKQTLTKDDRTVYVIVPLNGKGEIE